MALLLCSGLLEGPRASHVPSGKEETDECSPAVSAIAKLAALPLFIIISSGEVQNEALLYLRLPC